MGPKGTGSSAQSVMVHAGSAVSFVMIRASILDAFFEEES